MQRIIVQVEPQELDELDDVAAQESTSRSALIRDAIALYLAERRRAQEFAAVVSSYRQEPAENLVAGPDAVRRAWPD